MATVIDAAEELAMVKNQAFIIIGDGIKSGNKSILFIGLIAVSY